MDTRQQHNPVVSSDEWYTPRWIIDALGPFDLDPCAPANRPYDIAPRFFTKEDDGLTQDWGTDRVWLNPPYSRILLRAFVEKLAHHNHGTALLVNRTDNLMFFEVIFPHAASMLFMRNRVKFIRPDGSTGNPFFGSVLIAFGPEDDTILRTAALSNTILGKYVKLNPI